MVYIQSNFLVSLVGKPVLAFYGNVLEQETASLDVGTIRYMGAFRNECCCHGSVPLFFCVLIFLLFGSRFMQGPDTDPEDVAKIREAVVQGKNYCGRLLNYKKDGTAFWNLLTIAPIKDEDGKVLKFIG